MSLSLLAERIGLYERVVDQVLRVYASGEIDRLRAPQLGQCLRYYRGKIRGGLIDCCALTPVSDGYDTLASACDAAPGLLDTPIAWLCQPQHAAYFNAVATVHRLGGGPAAVLHDEARAQRWLLDQMERYSPAHRKNFNQGRGL